MLINSKKYNFSIYYASVNCSKIHRTGEKQKIKFSLKKDKILNLIHTNTAKKKKELVKKLKNMLCKQDLTL